MAAGAPCVSPTVPVTIAAVDCPTTTLEPSIVIVVDDLPRGLRRIPRLNSVTKVGPIPKPARTSAATIPAR